MFNDIALVFFGLSSGAVVAAGVFSFITMIGVVTRLVARTKTIRHTLLYEDMVILGGTVGNLISIFEWKIPGGSFLILMFAFFSGIFVGCLALALAEALNVFPVFTRRIKLKTGFPIMILFLAFGKFFGTLYQMYFHFKP